MKNPIASHPSLPTLILAVGVWSAAAAPAAAQTALVLRTLTPPEASAVDGLASVPQADLNLRTAAAVVISTIDKAQLPNPIRKQSVQRRNLGLDAAVYASLPAKTAPLLPAGTAAYVHDFVKVGDSVQAWATMTAQGVPHLRIVGHGEFAAESTASWTGRYTLAGSTSKELVLRFMVPPTVVDGDTEGDAPAAWRARMRTDVLVNGYPAWSTEALRLRADYSKPNPPGPPLPQELAVLQTFGDPLVFPTNDEDLPPLQGGPANDTDKTNMANASDARIVHLSLGRFNPGQQVEISMIVRGNAFTEARDASKTDHRCRERPTPGEWFCSRGSMAVKTGNMAPTLTLLP